jgi:hypothetical protein
MSYENKKLERATELFNEIKEREEALEALFGGEQLQPRRGRPRKEKENGRGDSGAMDETLPLGGNPARDGAT